MGEKCNVLKLQYIIIKERKMQFFQIMLMYSHLPNTSFELGGKLKTFSFCNDLAFFFPCSGAPSPLSKIMDQLLRVTLVSSSPTRSISYSLAEKIITNLKILPIPFKALNHLIQGLMKP